MFTKKNELLVFSSAVFLTVFSFIFFSGIVNATSGCCSWHGGVSYCDTSTGRQVCNDGTYSPSCSCTYIPPKPIVPTPSTKLKAIGTTNLAGQTKYCGFGELFNNQKDADKSKTDVIYATRQPLVDENDKLKNENQNLKTEREKFKKEATDNDTAFTWTFWLLVASLIAHWIVYSKRIKK